MLLGVLLRRDDQLVLSVIDLLHGLELRHDFQDVFVLGLELGVDLGDDLAVLVDLEVEVVDLGLSFRQVRFDDLEVLRHAFELGLTAEQTAGALAADHELVGARERDALGREDHDAARHLGQRLFVEGERRQQVEALDDGVDAVDVALDLQVLAQRFRAGLLGPGLRGLEVDLLGLREHRHRHRSQAVLVRDADEVVELVQVLDDQALRPALEGGGGFLRELVGFLAERDEVRQETADDVVDVAFGFLELGERARDVGRAFVEFRQRRVAAFDLVVLLAHLVAADVGFFDLGVALGDRRFAVVLLADFLVEARLRLAGFLFGFLELDLGALDLFLQDDETFFFFLRFALGALDFLVEAFRADLVRFDQAFEVLDLVLELFHPRLVDLGRFVRLLDFVLEAFDRVLKFLRDALGLAQLVPLGVDLRFEDLQVAVVLL
jgi:hypothetical protein